MPSNQSPWIDVRQSSPGIKPQDEVSSAYQRYTWQAMFACQIGIKLYEDRLKLKWGFSPAFLLEEALDRQKLFIASQLSNNPIDRQSEQRTLALRCICIPESGLQLGLVAKVQAESQEDAELFALNYLREIEAIFPYDYTIRPATSMEEFNQLTGKELIEQCTEPASLAQIRRFEQPLRTSQGVFRVLGLWQTEMRSDEQIWRALANYPREILFNVTLCPTTLLEGERRALLEMKQLAQGAQDALADEPYLQNFEAWIEPFIDRHISPWNKYFYLQVHLASPQNLDDHIFRNIGSAITRDNADQSSPGFQVARPLNNHDALEWLNHLDCLNNIPANNNILLPRLSELASLEETHTVFRLPYPPEMGLPNTIFLE